MGRVSVLILFLSLQSSCFASLGYLPPTKCVPEREIYYKFDKQIITQTEQLPAITDTITIQPETSYISMYDMTTVLVVTETEQFDPETVNVTHESCHTTRHVEAIVETVDLTATVTAEPIVKTKIKKVIEWEAPETVTDVVTVTTTLPHQIKINYIKTDITNTLTVPAEVVMSTLFVTDVDIRPAVFKTINVDSTIKIPQYDVTEQHADITMMSPPSIIVRQINVTETNILPAVTKMTMYTTTELIDKECGGYDYKPPATYTTPEPDYKTPRTYTTPKSVYTTPKESSEEETYGETPPIYYAPKHRRNRPNASRRRPEGLFTLSA